MSPEKRKPIVLTPIRGFRRELDHLYARRSALENLIQSLERYDRYYRVPSVDEQKSRTA